MGMMLGMKRVWAYWRSPLKGLARRQARGFAWYVTGLWTGSLLGGVATFERAAPWIVGGFCAVIALRWWGERPDVGEATGRV